MSSLLIRGGIVVTLGDANRVLPRASVYVEGDMIVEVGACPNRAADREIDAAGCVVMPGLINAHHHFYSTLARGFTPPGEPAANFQQILERLWWKVDRALEPNDVYLSAILPLMEAARAGCTTIIDHHASPSCAEGSLDLIEKAVREVGLNACLCYEVSDRNREGDGVEENARFIRKCRAAKDDQVTALFGLHASMTIGPRTLERCAARARELGVGVHAHIDEAECDGDVTRARFGTTPARRFRDAGLAHRGSLFAHGIHLGEEGMDILAEGGAMMVTNPESNMNNGLFVTPMEDLLRRGVLLGLGTDGMSNAMIAQARALYLLHRDTRRDPRVAFAEAGRLLLDHNRRICGRLFARPRGALEAGHLADIAIFEYTPFTPLEEGTFLGHLLFGLVGAPVRHTICRGRLVVENGRIPHLDEAAIRAKAIEAARALWRRIR
jgi:putative selenium metabolism protein SsnA